MKRGHGLAECKRKPRQIGLCARRCLSWAGPTVGHKTAQLGELCDEQKVLRDSLLYLVNPERA